MAEYLTHGDITLWNEVNCWEARQAEVYGSCLNNFKNEHTRNYAKELNLDKRLLELDKEVSQHAEEIRRSGYFVMERLHYLKQKCMIIENQPSPVQEYATKERKIVPDNYSIKVRLLGGNELWKEEIFSVNSTPLQFYHLPENLAQLVDPNSPDNEIADGSKLETEVLPQPSLWKWEPPIKTQSRKRKEAAGNKRSKQSEEDLEDDEDDDCEDETPAKSIKETGKYSVTADQDGKGVFIHTFTALVYGRRESRKLKAEVPFRHYYGLIVLNGYRKLTLPCALVSNYARQWVQAGGDKYFTSLLMFYGHQLPPPAFARKEWVDEVDQIRKASFNRSPEFCADFLDRVMMTRLADGRRNGLQRPFHPNSKRRLLQMLEELAGNDHVLNWETFFKERIARSKAPLENIFFDLLKEMRMNAAFLSLFARDFCLCFADSREVEALLGACPDKEVMAIRVCNSMDEAHLAVSYWRKERTIKHDPVQFSDLIKDSTWNHSPYKNIKRIVGRPSDPRGTRPVLHPVKNLRKLLKIDKERRNGCSIRGPVGDFDPYNYEIVASERLLRQLKDARETLNIIQEQDPFSARQLVTLGPELDEHIEILRRITLTGTPAERPESTFSEMSTMSQDLESLANSLTSDFLPNGVGTPNTLHDELSRQRSGFSLSDERDSLSSGRSGDVTPPSGNIQHSNRRKSSGDVHEFFQISPQNQNFMGAPKEEGMINNCEEQCMYRQDTITLGQVQNNDDMVSYEGYGEIDNIDSINNLVTPDAWSNNNNPFADVFTNAHQNYGQPQQ
jgi:hypothetical protein